MAPDREVRRLDKWEEKGTIAIQIFFNIQVLFPDILEQPCNDADILYAILRKIGFYHYHCVCAKIAVIYKRYFLYIRESGWIYG